MVTTGGVAAGFRLVPGSSTPQLLKKSKASRSRSVHALALRPAPDRLVFF